MRSTFGKSVLLVVFAAARVAAQSPEPSPAEPEVVLFIRDMTRFESWSFFEPHSAGADADYSLFSNRATLGIRVNSRRFHVEGAFQYAQVHGLPRRASGPGPLGPGALYFDAARTPAAYQLYFKTLSLRVRDITPGVSLEAGRMRFNSGHFPPADDASIETITRDRLAGRLIGEVEWSTFERAFDGVRVDVERPRWHTTAALVFPTQGGFEESANPTMGSVRVGAAALTRRLDAADVQLFALHYRDRRDIELRPDNTLLPATTADVSMATIGASHVGRYAVGRGHLDSLLWISGQFGDWYGDRHRAFSVMTEGGYRWQVPWSPWVRGGMLHASGDDNPRDRRHETFFPMLPSTRPNLFAATFAQMNVRDLFVQIRLRPQTRLFLSADVHRMSLAQSRDAWYSGTGATARRGNFFGYVGRSSSGATDLGTLLQVSAESPLTRRWSMQASVGTVKGGEVVRRLFARDRLIVFALESRVSF